MAGDQGYNLQHIVLFISHQILWFCAWSWWFLVFLQPLPLWKLSLSRTLQYLKRSWLFSALGCKNPSLFLLDFCGLVVSDLWRFSSVHYWRPEECLVTFEYLPLFFTEVLLRRMLSYLLHAFVLDEDRCKETVYVPLFTCLSYSVNWCALSPALVLW